MYHHAYNFFDERPRVVSAMTLLHTVHSDNKRYAQLIQLRKEQEPIIKSEVGNSINLLVPKEDWTLGEDVYFSLNTFKSYHRRSDDCVRLMLYIPI